LYYPHDINYRPFVELELSEQKADILIAMQPGIIRAGSRIDDHLFATLGGKYK